MMLINVTDIGAGFIQIMAKIEMKMMKLKGLNVVAHGQTNVKKTNLCQFNVTPLEPALISFHGSGSVGLQLVRYYLQSVGKEVLDRPEFSSEPRVTVQD